MKHKKGNPKKYLLTVLLFFGIFVALGIGLFIYKTSNRFVYEKHLDDVIVSVDEEQVTLRDFGYYILLMERDTQETAVAYDAKYPINYWNLYIGKSETELGYVRNIAKEYAIEYCIRDLVYGKEMKENQISFSGDEKKEIERSAKEVIEGFTEEQLKATGLSPDELFDKALNVSEVHHYLESFTELGIAADELDISGNYYRQKKAERTIFTNEELINQITFGTITVN